MEIERLLKLSKDELLDLKAQVESEIERGRNNTSQRLTYKIVCRDEEFRFDGLTPLTEFKINLNRIIESK